MAVEIYGIDQTRVSQHYPQVEVSLTASITPTSLATMILSAAGRVNAVLRAHGVDPATIAADTASDAYEATRSLVLTCLKPLIDEALLVDPTRSEAECEKRIEAFEALPQIFSVGGDGSNIAPGFSSSVDYLGIEISDAVRDDRRQFGAKFSGF